MKLFYTWIGICVVILTALLILYFSKKSDYEDLLSDLKILSGKEEDLSSQSVVHDLLNHDLNIAKNEWFNWNKLSKNQSNFWRSYLDESNNIYFNQSNKSSSSINTELTRLISQLLRECEKSNVNFISENNTPSPFLETDQKTSGFSFGFSGYDGFWPSFEKEEANRISVQSKIIKQIVEIFLNSFKHHESPTLYSIKREAAGQIDRKYINDDLITINTGISLLRSVKFLDSQVFEISFMGKTDNLRSFINQIRAPFSLRSILVNRDGTTSELSEQASFFASKETTSDQNILPIIRNIDSIFIIQLEYITEANVDLFKYLSSYGQNDLERFFSEDYITLK